MDRILHAQALEHRMKVLFGKAFRIGEIEFHATPP